MLMRIGTLVASILVFFTTFSCAQSQQTSQGHQVAQSGPEIAERFRSLDKNGDGMISREEFPGPEAKFERLDLNGDGLISREELKTIIEKRRQRVSTPAPEDQARPESKSITQPARQTTVLLGLCSTGRQLKHDVKYVQELDISAVRIPIAWQSAEPREGQFNWGQIDSLVDLAHSHGIEILLNVRSISPWGTKKQTQKKAIYHSGSPPRDLRKWEGFMETLATRYRGRGVHYEIENEVSAKAFWDGTKEEYAELLRASYTAVKRGDPQAMVLPAAMPAGISRSFGGPADSLFKRNHDDWLRVILPTKAFNAVNVHDYYFPSEIVANGFTFRSYLQHIRDLMKDAGVEDRPIWITETGYVSKTSKATRRIDAGSPEKQAKWIEEAFQQASKLGVERIFWILLRDRKEEYFGSMGLADAQGNPRLSWKRLQALKKVRGSK